MGIINYVLGGSGGGAVEIVGHHVLLDGSIRVDGNSVEDWHSRNVMLR